MSFDRTMLAMPDRHGSYIDLPVPSTDFRRPMVIGFAVIGIALGGFGGWAALAPLDSAVVAQGVVTVEGKKKTVQHREGGIVKSLAVKEGEVVAAGAIIARLDDQAAEALVATLRGQVESRQAERARLIAERDGQSAIAFPAALLDRRGEARVDEVIHRETDRFAERRRSLDGQTGILRQRIAQLEQQRFGRGRMEASKREQLVLLKDEVAGLRSLEAKGFYPRNKLRAAERELARMQGEMMSDGAGANQTDKEIGETRLQIMQLEQKFREEVTGELAKAELEINDIGAKLVAARDAVARLVVVAPVAGQIQSLKIAGAGAVVPPGGEVAEIVPGGNRLVIEAQISPRDVDNVRDGQATELRFSAFSSRTTPVLWGEVQMVSPDRIVDPATHQPYYLAHITVERSELDRLPQPLKAGMPVEVMVKAGERTPLQYLLKPLMDSFARGLKEV